MPTPPRRGMLMSGESNSPAAEAIGQLGDGPGCGGRGPRKSVESDHHADGSTAMKIATYNVNSVNARLPVLLRWLAESRPDVACLQELKAPQEKFPYDAIRDAGYH